MARASFRKTSKRLLRYDNMKVGTAPCGLKYAVKRRPCEAAYCALTIGCGTRDELAHHSGIAHFTEHTLFKGTKSHKAPYINSCLDRLGGELNAFTTKEEIVLNATVLKEDLPKAARLIFELATEATFPQKEIETEKGVVIDEIRSYKDAPADEIYDRFEAMLFEGHPLERLILGTEGSVKKISSAELSEFVGENFTPDKMAFSLVADLAEEKLEQMALKLCESYFSGNAKPWTRSSEPFARTLPPFDKTLNKRNHQANCIIGGLAPSLYSEDERIAAILLSNILGGPAANSRLNSLLREKNGLVYDVECGYTQYADAGVMAIMLGCERENLDKCLRLIDRELVRMKEELLTPRKLEAAKKQLLGQLAINSDNPENQCLSMGKAMLCFGSVATKEQSRELIEEVSAEKVQSLSRSIFDPGKLCKLVFL